MNRSFVDRNLDANANRASEGLRVLMDWTRFGLDHPDFSDRLKRIRHSLIALVASGPQDLARHRDSRDSAGDVSRPDEVAGPSPSHTDCLDLFEANSRRVEEALRSIEESLRLVDPEKAREVEHLRYATYDLQKEIFPFAQKASHRSKLDFELYVVTDRPLSKGRSLEEVVRSAVRGGAGCIQIREKHAGVREILELARPLRKITREEGVTFIVNDSLEVALEVEADGVHIGQDDLPLDVARRLSRGSLLLGVSTHNPEQALEAEAGGADCVNIGPIFPTQTKGLPVDPVTPELIRTMKPRLKVPFTVMGGIHLDNVEEVVLAGADRIAVVSEVVSADNIEKAARDMVEAIRRAKDKREER